MTETLKVLGEQNPSATTLTDLYTVPAGTQAVVSRLHVTNRSATATSYRVSIAIAGAADDNKQYIAYDVPIAANETEHVKGATGLALGPGDVVRVYATLATLTFVAAGVETTAGTGGIDFIVRETGGTDFTSIATIEFLSGDFSISQPSPGVARIALSTTGGGSGSVTSNELSAASAQAASAIAAETSNRVSADNVLSAAINVVSNAVSNEISVRTSAVNAVSNAASNALSVANAASNAASIVSTAASNALSVANAASNAASIVSTAASNALSVANAASNAASVVSNALSNEISNRASAINVVSNAASNAASIANAASNAASVVSVAVDVVSNALSNEISVRTSAVNAVSNAASNALSVANAASNAASIVSTAASNALSVANAASNAASIVSNQLSVVSSQVSNLTSAHNALSNVVSAWVSGVSARSAGDVSTRGPQSIVNALSNRISVADVHANTASAAATSADAHANTASAAATSADAHANTASAAATSADAHAATASAAATSVDGRVNSVNVFISGISALSIGGVSTHGLQSVINALSNRLSVETSIRNASVNTASLAATSVDNLTQRRSKSATAQVISATALADIASLSISMEASTVYEIRGNFSYECGTSGGFAFGVSLPALHAYGSHLRMWSKSANTQTSVQNINLGMLDLTAIAAANTAILSLSIAAINARRAVNIDGVVATSAAGGMQIMARTSVAGSSLSVFGGYIIAYKIGKVDT